MDFAIRSRSRSVEYRSWVLSGAFSVGFIYEQGTLNEFGLLGNATSMAFPVRMDDDANNWYLTGRIPFGNNTIRAAYGQMDTGVDVPELDDNIDNYLVGYQYDFSKRTRVWVEYIGRSADTTFSMAIRTRCRSVPAYDF